MTADCDVLIVGGGPIGLVSALYARRAGLSVVVAEPREGDIDKACGEGIMPSALARLQTLGVDPTGRDFLGIAYVDANGRRVTARFRHGSGRGVRRLELHRSLRGAADSASVQRNDERLSNLKQDNNSVTACGLNARWLLAADGLHSPTRRLLGLELERTGNGSRAGLLRRRYGLRRHYRVRPWSEVVEVHWSRHAELYVTPVADDVVGLAVLTAHRGRSFDEWLDEFPLVAQRIRCQLPASEVRGAGPLEQPVRRRVAGRVLLVGDAAGYVDALTGEGLALGMASAEAAVRAIASGQPEAYEAEWQALSRTSRSLTYGLLRATSIAPVRRALVPAARTLPGIYEAIVAKLA